jgi:hypothetical protein
MGEPRTSLESAEVARYRQQLGEWLGLAGPLPEETFLAAVADPSYAHELMMARPHPELRDRLVARPPALAPLAGEAPGGAELVATAASAMLRWAQSGFATVEAATLRARLDACERCPHLRMPPTDARRFLYQLVGVQADRRVVCGVCGCSVLKKARRAGETCPDRDPEDGTRSRWGAMG